MKRILLQLLFLTSTLGFAQVGVNTTTPDPSSMLDISATNKGVLVPRVSLTNVTTTQLDGTNTAATGLLIWNTNTTTTGGNGVGFYFFNGAIWIPLTQAITGNTLDQSYDQGGPGVGKNINATDGSVRVNGDDGFLITGTFGTGNTIDTEITGAGTRMFFNPRKAAFRAGQADGTEWNNANIGNYSIALGRSNTALNDYDVAIGIGSTASGSYSTALGWANTASGAYSFSMGQNSVASGWSSTVLGRLSTATQDNSMVFGNYSSATGQSSFAFGNEAIASGLNSLAFGNNLTSKSGYESVFGIYNTDYTPLSVGGFNNADRLFVIGNGTSSTNLSNALTIFKDGRMNINDAYNMPTTDGINGQVMQTNGAGIVSWTTPTSGSDDQQIDVLSLTGDTLNISLQDDGMATQTLNLSAIDNQATDVFSLTGTTLNLSLQNDGVATQTVDLSSLRDHDIYEIGGTTAPDAITDNKYTEGSLAIGSNTAATGVLDVDNATRATSFDLNNTFATNPVGVNVDITSANSAKTGVKTTFNGASATGNNTFISNIDNTSGNNNRTGILQEFNGTSSSIATSIRGVKNDFKSTASYYASIFGFENSFADNTNSFKYGLTNNFLNGGISQSTGVLNNFNGISTGTAYGVYNYSNNYNGQLNGLYNVFSGTGNNQHYGVYNILNGTGTGDKYGVYNFIPTTAGGTHYGLYSDVLKAGSYAGYFLGRISIGTTTSNNYILPPSRGTANQIMQTDGVGNVTWVNPPTDTDDQTTDVFSLTGTTLNLSLQNDGVPTQTVDLSTLDTDNQNIDVLTLTGDTLNISLIDDGIPTQTLNLAAIDNQATDVFSLTGTTLNLSLQNDGVPTQTVNLASLVGTDDQNLVTPTLVGTTLNLNIENGTGTSINLASLDTDNQQIDAFSLTGTTLNLSLQDDGVATQTVDLSSLRDHDWYEVGGTTPPNSITDNKYTQGTVTIGNNIAATGMVDINNSTRNTALNVTNTSTLIPSGIDVQLNSTSPTKIGINIDLNGINTSSISSFMNNRDECQTTGNLVGIYQSFDGSNTVNFNSIIGVRNWFLTTSGYQGFITGTSNEIYNNLNGIHYGNFNRLEGTGTGNKYGTYNLIETTAGGTHYGLFSEVLKSGSYAGYFLGNVSIGTSTLNNYILPPSRGTNGQIMQTNAAGNVTWVNPPIDTDDQNIDVLTLTGDTLNISLANDGVPTQTLNLAAIDNQTVDTFSLVGTTLRLSLENDGLPIQTVNLASLVGTDDQNLVTPTLVGTTLNLNIENGTGTSIDLAPLQDGTGTDDQNIQNLAFNSTSNVLTVGIENGTSQTVNLSSLSNDWKLIGNAGTNPTTNFIGTTDNQDLSFRTNNTEKVRITAKGQIETTQAQSVWIGNQAGENITTGTRNTFVGHTSGFSSTIGNDNTAFGGLSLYSNTTGFDNTAIGLAALFNLNSGSGNTAVGEQVAENMTSGDYNTFMGHLAAENYTTGTRNTVIGYQAGQNAAGDGNVFIGSGAGRSETGSNKLYIENSGVDQDNALLYGEFDNNILRTYGEFQVRQNSSSTLSHIQLREDTANDGARIKFTNAGEIINSWTLFCRADDVIADSRFNIFHTTTGNIMQVTGDGLVGIMRTPTTNQLEINGTASKSTAGGFLANSDSRLKKNIVTIDPQDALKKVLNLRGVTYEWDDYKTGMNRPEGQQLGFVAQEIQTVFPEKVSTDNQGYLQTSYGDYDPIIFQAFKALNDKIENLENENKDLKSELEKYKQLEERIKALEQK